LDQCRGYQCTNTDVIEAHVIARVFAKDVRGAQRHNLLISRDNVRHTQLGVFDRKILCGACDGKLGKLDNYAASVCRCFPSRHTIRADGLFEMTAVNGDRFATFVLSVLWRASISSRPEVAKVSLGSYEDRAREVIFGAKPLSDIPEYELFIERYYRGIGQRFNPAGNYTMPARMMTRLTGWYFGLNGFRILAKLAPWPAQYPGQPVNGNDRLVGSFVDYKLTTEGQAMIANKLAEDLRRQSKVRQCRH
jgi:hypothetical protein